LNNAQKLFKCQAFFNQKIAITLNFWYKEVTVWGDRNETSFSEYLIKMAWPEFLDFLGCNISRTVIMMKRMLAERFGMITDET